jgi:hypothetical protein
MAAEADFNCICIAPAHTGIGRMKFARYAVKNTLNIVFRLISLRHLSKSFEDFAPSSPSAAEKPAIARVQ